MGQFSEFYDALFDAIRDSGGEDNVGIIMVSKELIEEFETTGGVDFDGTITVQHHRGPIYEVIFHEQVKA
jgi:hypothetical protein